MQSHNDEPKITDPKIIEYFTEGVAELGDLVPMASYSAGSFCTVVLPETIDWAGLDLFFSQSEVLNTLWNGGDGACQLVVGGIQLGTALTDNTYKPEEVAAIGGLNIASGLLAIIATAISSEVPVILTGVSLSTTVFVLVFAYVAALQWKVYADAERKVSSDDYWFADNLKLLAFLHRKHEESEIARTEAIQLAQEKDANTAQDKNLDEEIPSLFIEMMLCIIQNRKEAAIKRRSCLQREMFARLIKDYVEKGEQASFLFQNIDKVDANYFTPFQQNVLNKIKNIEVHEATFSERKKAVNDLYQQLHPTSKEKLYDYCSRIERTSRHNARQEAKERCVDAVYTTMAFIGAILTTIPGMQLIGICFIVPATAYFLYKIGKGLIALHDSASPLFKQAKENKARKEAKIIDIKNKRDSMMIEKEVFRPDIVNDDTDTDTDADTSIDDDDFQKNPYSVNLGKS